MFYLLLSNTFRFLPKHFVKKHHFLYLYALISVESYTVPVPCDNSDQSQVGTQVMQGAKVTAHANT